jgi:RNA polymerase sigma-70 factor (ECF subfamily)
MPAPAEERALVECIRQGDQDAFDALSGRYWDALYRFAYRHVRSTDAAADVVQDVLFHVWRRRDQLDAGRSIRPYLFGAVRRRVLELLRHERVVAHTAARYEAKDISGLGPGPSDVAHEVEQQGFVDALERLLTTVPAARREILVLRWWYGMEYHEIAAIVGLGESAVKMQVHRAVRQFRPLLEQEFGR